MNKRKGKQDNWHVYYLRHVIFFCWELSEFSLAWCRWPMPVILVTQEAEIRRIAVPSQPRQTVCETLSGKPITKIGLVEWLKV
jgi:hypothetical protein